MSHNSVSNDGRDRQSSITPVMPHVGDRLTVNMSNLRVDGVNGRDLHCTLPDGAPVVLPLDCPAVQVTRVFPSWWPPTPGSVVLIGGSRRWVVKSGGTLWLYDEHGCSQDARVIIDDARAVGAPVELVEAAAAQPSTSCGATSWTQPHAWTPDPLERDEDGYDGWERCGAQPGDPIHNLSGHEQDGTDR